MEIVGSGWEHLILTNGMARWSINGPRTAEPAAIDPPCLVWLIDSGGEAQSNRVPLDDRRALDAALNVRAGPPDRPPDIDEPDLEHPLGLLLAQLYRSALFSIDESPASRRAESLRASDSTSNSEFWDTFVRDNIRLDPRYARYSAWALNSTGPPPWDEFRWLIEQMLAMTPPRAGLIVLPDRQVCTAADREAAGRQWAPTTRLANSTFHVLGRWADALSDSRVRWLLADFAPIDHYERLVGTIAQIWAQGDSWFGNPEQYRPRFGRLLERLWRSFVQAGGTGTGYLSALNDREREQALELLQTGGSPAIGAALAYAGLVNAKPSRFFEWQSFLTSALQWRVIEPGPGTTELVHALVSLRPSVDHVAARLRFVAEYMDDERWSKTVQETLGFVRLKRRDVSRPAYDAEIELEPGVDLVRDPRIVMLAREALRYRGPKGVRIKSGADVLVVAARGPAVASIADHIKSAPWLDTSDMDLLIEESAGFDSWLADETA